jgi:hypothetical protein
VSDPDHADNELTWSWSGNTSLTVTWDATRRRLRIRYPRTFTGSETITFTATDPEGASDSDAATFTVNPAAAGADMTLLEDAAVLEDDVNETSTLAAKTGLYGNFPNPFNPATLVRYSLAEDTWVSLKIYNALGQEVASLVDGFQNAGQRSVVWEGKNNAGEHVTSGIYFSRLTAGNVVDIKKMIMMK